MKWISNIFKRDNSEDPALVLDLSNLDDWLEQKAKNPEFEKTVKEIYANIGSVAEDLERDIKALRFSSPDKSIPPRLLNAGLAARDALQIQIKGILEKLASPHSEEIDVAIKYHSVIVRSLGITITKFGKSQRYVAAIFPKEAENLKYTLNRLSHHLVDLNDAIDKKQASQQKINESRELGAKIKDEVCQIRLKGKNLEDTEKKLHDLAALEKKTASELQDLKSSDEGLRIEALKDRLDKNRYEIAKIEAKMAELISPMTKAFTRLVKQDSSDRLELQHRIALELIFTSPQEALNSDISGPLRELQSSVDLLGLKDKKREKILEHIGRLIQDKSLEALKAQHSEISLTLLNLDRELSLRSHDMMEMEEALKQTSMLIEKQESNADQIRKSISFMKDRASKDKMQLEAILEKIAGQPLTVDIEK